MFLNCIRWFRLSMAMAIIVVQFISEKFPPFRYAFCLGTLLVYHYLTSCLYVYVHQALSQCICHFDFLLEQLNMSSSILVLNICLFPSHHSLVDLQGCSELVFNDLVLVVVVYSLFSINLVPILFRLFLFQIIKVPQQRPIVSILNQWKTLTYWTVTSFTASNDGVVFNYINMATHYLS